MVDRKSLLRIQAFAGLEGSNPSFSANTKTQIKPKLRLGFVVFARESEIRSPIELD